MRQVLICTIVAVLAVAQGFKIHQKEDAPEIVVYDFVGDLINSTIEGIRPSIPDPLEIDDLPIDLPGSPLSGSARVNNFQLIGLQGFQIPVLDFNLFKFTAEFVFGLPKLNLNTNYWADILLADLIPIYGEGKININIQNLTLSGGGGIDFSNGIKGLQLKNITIIISLQAATFDIHGLLDDENFSLIVSSILNDSVASFINENQEVITNLLSGTIEAILNALLSSILNNDENAELVRYLEEAYQKQLINAQLM